MKKRAWITALGLLITVSPAQAEENTSVTSYLNTMSEPHPPKPPSGYRRGFHLSTGIACACCFRQHQFAWGQQYPMEGCA